MLPVPWVLAAAGAIHVLGDTAGVLELTNRTEVRGRTTQNVTPNPSVDLADTAAARVGIAARQWAYTLGYSAMFTAPDVEILGAPTLLHSADLGAAWHDRRTRVGLAEYVSYGENNAGTSGPIQTPTGGGAPPPAGVTAINGSQTVRFGGSRTALLASEQLSRRALLGLTLEYSIQGGLDATSQLTSPLVRGPRAEASLLDSLTRRDRLETRVMAQRSDADTGPCAVFIQPWTLTRPGQPCTPVGQIEQVTESWLHSISHATIASVGVGLAYVQMRFQDAQPGFDTALLPVGVAGLQFTDLIDGQRTTYHAELAAAPFVDLRSGLIDERAQLTGGFTHPHRRWIYHGLVGGTRSIASPYLQPLTLIQTSFEVEYVASPTVTFGGGARFLWQDQEGQGQVTYTTLFASVTLHAPRLRF